MPPEPFPWDRRDFRKHERSGSDPRFGGGYGGGGPPRWREQHHGNAPPSHPPPYHHHQQQQQQRWYSDFRSRPLPPGHGKQAGWHMHSDEAVHGFPPYGSRLIDRNVTEDSYRPFGSCSEGGRHFRNNRESRGSFSQKYWRATSWEPFSSPNVPGRSAETNDQRFLENTQAGTINHVDNNCTEGDNSSLPPPDLVNPSDHCQSTTENLQDKDAEIAKGLTDTVKVEKENLLGCINWKPLKWSRSGSLSSKGSSLSRSSSSKSVGVDSIETVSEVQQKKVTPVQSPTSDANAGVVTYAPVPSEETSSRKKPRLGWGEGLAKYEKKKIDGPEDNLIKSSRVMRISIGEESVQSHTMNLLDKSPRVAGFLDCASPATPSSVAYSSSPGIEEKGFMKATNVIHDTSDFSCSPSIISNFSYEGPCLNLENMEHSSLASISSLISFQSDHPCSGEAYHVEVNKVLLWKSDITKVLEKTEYEIDLLETELKSLTSETSKGFSLPDSSSGQLEELISKTCEEHATGIDSTLRPGCLQIVSSGDTHIEKIPVAVEDSQLRLIAENIDCSPCEKSTCVDVPSCGEDSYPNQVAQVVVNLDGKNSSYLDGDCQGTYIHTDGNTECVGCRELTVTTSCQDISGDSDMYYDTFDVYGSILASNKDLTNGASEALNKLLPYERLPFDVMPKSCASSLKSDSSVVKNNFLSVKRFLQFKEKILTIKYKLFQHFWVQGRIVSVRKLRALSHKKFDLIRHKRHHYGRTRISGSAGNSRTVYPEDIIDVVRHLLSESQLKPCRNTLRMPALMLDKKALQIWRFISGNGIVEDPCAFEKERGVINSWTIEEGEIFIDKLAIFGKNFRKIASFLDHKTTADCVEFYYKNHKSDCFKRARKKPDVMKQSKSQCTTFMVASGNRRTREAAACSLDMLGAASAIVATADARAEICQKSTPKVCFDASNAYKTPRSYDCPSKRSNSPDLYSSEIETAAADVLAGICGSLSSEAISSCITSSVDHGDGYHDRRYQRIGFCSKPLFTSEATHSIDDECSDESCGELDATDWSNEEKSLFMQALSSYGKDFEMISQCVGTRSRNQCIVFYSKARKCLSLDMIESQPGIAVYGYVNGGSSDVEDASVLETGSVVCNEGLYCKIEEHLLRPDMNLGCESDSIEGKADNDHGNLSSLVHMDTEPVLQSLLIDNGKCSDKHVLDFSVDVNGQIGVDGVSVSVEKLGTMTVSPNAKIVQRIEAPDECCCANGSTNAENMAFVEVSDGYHEKDSNPKQFSSTKKVERIDVNSADVYDMNWAARMNSDTEPAGNTSHLATTVDSALQVDISKCQIRGNLGYSSTENSHVGSLHQNDQIASLNCSTLFSVPIKYQNLSSHNSSSPVGVIGIGEGLSSKIAKTGGHALSDIESSQILRGYPVPVPIVNEEINSCLSGKLQVPLHLVPSTDENLCADRHVEFSLQKCSKSGHYCEDASLPLHEQTIDKSSPLPCCSSDIEKPSKTGDVKLFGKILTSSQQKSNSCGQQKDDNNSRKQKLGCSSVDLKFNGEQVNSDSTLSKLDCNNSLGSENNPFMNFGFWDGNRRTGLPPLPDSTLLLAKYPAAFSNYTRAATKVEQPAVQGVVKSNDHSLNGVSMFPSRELCSSSEYVKNQEVQQPFTIDMQNPREAFFSEMQRRNVFNAVSGMQHQSRGGIIGRGVVGGHCSGVSDPVAAIKMHYANADRFCLQTGNIIKEEETWSSKGDIGR